ncbi:hypothetical protein [Pseudoalteromonas denitrificans]|jgi:hypothetical protein|uniref:Uncharacterized protein n=1 Tax=Pseudoalteromonas denitrificans DSM 6059 TaxID=1123010 RepID=A0A1I1PVG2_9GAMM|nr:hypothetical protein [Pseudoalteromonas denitrificans]SFD11568.1 hypothetical protein SAMN02745724_03540 [Pseudoalteromonas denitrificans DSM 6059]
MKIFLTLFTLMLITGCNGHPAAGQWLSATGNHYSKIVISFDGQAQVYKGSAKLPTYHCFWAAFNENSINLDCGAKNETQQNFTFEVTDTYAKLNDNKKLLATFSNVEI